MDQGYRFEHNECATETGGNSKHPPSSPVNTACGLTYATSNDYFPRDSALIEEKLLAAGVTPQRLMNDWGVILWSIRCKPDKIKLRLETCKTVDEAALRQYLTSILGTERSLSIKLGSRSKCCQSPCDGCMMMNAAKRAFWMNGSPS